MTFTHFTWPFGLLSCHCKSTAPLPVGSGTFLFSYSVMLVFIHAVTTSIHWTKPSFGLTFALLLLKFQNLNQKKKKEAGKRYIALDFLDFRFPLRFCCAIFTFVLACFTKGLKEQLPSVSVLNVDQSIW